MHACTHENNWDSWGSLYKFYFKEKISHSSHHCHKLSSTFPGSLQSLMYGAKISAKQRYFRTSHKVVIISPNISINSFRQSSTPSSFHYWNSGFEFERQDFFKLWQCGGSSWLIETALAGAKKKIHLANIKITRGSGWILLKMWPYLFLFYFSEFLMRTDFCWCAAHFNSTMESGSSTWAPIEMQKEASSLTRISFTCFHFGRREKWMVELTPEFPAETRL